MSPESEIDAVLGDAVRTGAVPGVVTTAATDRGVLHESASGLREIGKPASMTMDTVFWLASMTKAIAATAAMQLVERGRLDLDVPASKTLPQLGKVQVLEGFDAQSRPQLRTPRSAVTLRNLLTHTSGFAYEFWDADHARYAQVAGLPGTISGKKGMLDAPLMADPGTRWEYGIGIDWAGQMVEAASGMSLGDYLRRELFAPLGMTDTAFTLSRDMRSRLASVHARQADGTLVPNPFELPADAELQNGGHGLYSTARDYLRFLRMLLGGGSLDGARVLKPETVTMMGRNHIGALMVRPLKSLAPPLSKDGELLPGIPCKWGLSFLLNTQATPQGRSAGSLAWAGIANSYYWVDPVKRVAGVILMQIQPFLDDGAMKTFQDYESAVYRRLSA